MDQVNIRRGGDGVRRRGLAGLRELLAEGRLNAVQRLREVIGDIIGQALAREDVAQDPTEAIASVWFG